MEKYSIHKVTHAEDIFYCVYEIATKQVLDFFLFADDANDMVESLKKGKGFDGFTPSFILNSVPVVDERNINKKFKDLF